MNAPQSPSPGLARPSARACRPSPAAQAPVRPSQRERPARTSWATEVIVVAALALVSLWQGSDLPPEPWTALSTLAGATG